MTLPATPRIVRLGPEDRDEVLRVDQAAFAFDQRDLDPAVETVHFDWERTFGAVLPPHGIAQRRPGATWDDGEELAGVFTVYPLSVTVPGSAAKARPTPMAGLSWVSVHPDHRRQGVLTAMMRRHLHDLHDTGAEAISGLFASQPQIYPRFGYGESASGLSLKLPAEVSLRQLPETLGGAAVSTQMAELAAWPDAVQLVQDVFARTAATRVGRVSRPEPATRQFLRERPESHRGKERLQLVVASAEGEATGYALVRRTAAWADGSPAGTAEVLELVGTDTRTLHALWTRVVGFDLVTSIETPVLALDDPLLSWLVDVRSPLPRRTDGLWLRLVDVDRALIARGYARAVDLVLEIRDEWCPWNAGRWRLQAADGQAGCVRTQGRADLTLDVRELATAFLGGRSIAALAAAGLVEEHSAGAITGLSLAMRGLVEPAVSQEF